MTAYSEKWPPREVLLRNTGNRPLGALLNHIQGATYLGPRKPVAAQLSYAASVNRDAGHSELLAIGAERAMAGQSRTRLTHYPLAILCRGDGS